MLKGINVDYFAQEIGIIADVHRSFSILRISSLWREFSVNFTVIFGGISFIFILFLRLWNTELLFLISAVIFKILGKEFGLFSTANRDWSLLRSSFSVIFSSESILIHLVEFVNAVVDHHIKGLWEPDLWRNSVLQMFNFKPLLSNHLLKLVFLHLLLHSHSQVFWLNFWLHILLKNFGIDVSQGAKDLLLKCNGLGLICGEHKVGFLYILP